ncbi:MAG: MoxR family ATPase [Lachnospiraceae bacterium]|nr:MoxR family ATPase [Lachnospiraceae bacterium]
MKTNELIDNISKVIVGKEETIELLLTCMLAGGHVLLEDIPGTGKTKLARSIAASCKADFKRIQFTPDLLPSDVTGLNVYDAKQNEFVLKKGPVFTSILLADEINRATPRTQAGLLECMEERQVTIDGETYALKEPFFVIATQNPIENAGTFPLPEAQMDRFMMRLSMGLPSKSEEEDILRRFMKEEPLATLESVVTPEEIETMKTEIKEVFVHPLVLSYMVDIVQASRKASEVLSGASPRATIALCNAAKAYAYLKGRKYVNPDDVKKLAVPVLAHRLVMSFGSTSAKDAEAVIVKIINQVETPTENFEVG